MESKIQIDLAEDNQPVILIKYKESEDVRDKMIKMFYQSLGGDSSWARVKFTQISTEGGATYIELRPIKPSELIVEQGEMNKVIQQYGTVK